MNCGVQDSFNLGWKLALASKSLASPALLASYTSERLPVIVNILQKTTGELTKTLGGGWQRGLELRQLEINYRGSPIVFDELSSREEYGERVAAGDRAPDAPGLTDARDNATHLFNLFKLTHHTALIFSQDQSEISILVAALARYPKGAVNTIAFLPKGSEPMRSSDVVDLVLLDSEEHAWSSYPTAQGAKIVVVRPDGYVGLVAKGAEGLEKYRELVFAT